MYDPSIGLEANLINKEFLEAKAGAQYFNLNINQLITQKPLAMIFIQTCQSDM